ncbi:unnamed protein product [Cyclocybe aegerita]|uniref:Uncharacterized protein n=1 Tax=Cyclocybe aegerita TaxID=1973307 RepID=A0A8S0VXR3_CYCAE|nr:unnamed protein product [Cyclocybe aegerita]
MESEKDPSFAYPVLDGDGFVVNGEHVPLPRHSESKPLGGHSSISKSISISKLMKFSVIAMLASAFIFVLFLGIYLSPLFCTHRETLDTDTESLSSPQEKKGTRSLRIFRTGTRATARRTYNPLVYDVDSSGEVVESVHRVPSGGSYYLSRKRSLFKPLSSLSSQPSEAQMPIVFSTNRFPSPPPPAYTPEDGFRLLLTRTPTADTMEIPCRSESTRRPLPIPPKFITLSRKPTARLKISKPIPHPEGPLPGPRLSIESLPPGPRTTFVRPCVAPHYVTGSILHPPAIFLPSPSQAVIYHHDLFSSRNGSKICPKHRAELSTSSAVGLAL